MLIAGEAGPIARIGNGQPLRAGRDAERICQFWLWGQNRLLSTSRTHPTSRVADIYFGEFMRIFDHLYAWCIVAKMKKAGTNDPDAGFLKDTAGEWVW